MTFNYSRHFIILLLLTVLISCGTSTDPANERTSNNQTNNTTVVANSPPTLNGTSAASIVAGSEYRFTITAVDPENANVTFSVSNLPAWANFTDNQNNTATIRGVPSNSDAGLYQNIRITASDGTNTVQSPMFSVQVIANTTSSTQGSSQPTVKASYDPNFSNPVNLSGASLDNTEVTIFFEPGADWDTRGVNRVVFYCCKGGNSEHIRYPDDTTPPFAITVDLSSYTPDVLRELYADVFFDTQASPDNYTINFTIADAGGNSSGGGSTTPSNSAPTISGSPANSVFVDNTFSFVPTTSDADGDPLTFSISNQPSWTNFDTATGQLSGVPTSTHVGDYPNITIYVSDGTVTNSLPQFNISVLQTNTNQGPTAAYTANPVSGIGPLTVNFTATQSSNIVSYNWDFGDGNSATGPNQTNTYNQVGVYTASLTIADADNNVDVFERDIHVFASVDNTSAVVPDGVLFYDNFDYVVNRDSANASDLFSTNGGWRWAKTQQDYGSGNGYLYTVDSIPGYTGDFPGRSSTRVLAMEARPATFGAQTDFYLQYGDTDFPTDTIPGDVWFQYWIYPNSSGDQQSRFHWRNKFIYPCNGGYGCTTGKWLLYQGYSSASPYRDEVHDGSLYAHIGESRVSRIVNSNDQQVWWQNRPGQTDLNDRIAVNRWTLVKIHINTTSTSGNSFEMWLKPMGGQWRKVAEWIGGVTPGFEWTIPADQVGGHRVFRMPSTMPGGGNDPLYDSWIYLDDFTMTTSEETLPVYPY